MNLALLALSSILAISSPSWLIIWVCLEANIVVICLILGEESSEENSSHSVSLTYLIPQATASMVLLSVSYMAEIEENTLSLAIIGAILVNIGVWPAHSWYLETVENVNIGGTPILILITWQNLIPLIVISTLNTNPPVLLFIAVFSLVVTTIGLINNISTNSILVFSSMFYNGWTLLLTSAVSVLMVFLLAYWVSTALALKAFANMENKASTPNNNLTISVVAVANLSGLPPILIFSANVVALSNILWVSINEIACIIVITSSVFMFNYLWISSTQLTLDRQKPQLPVANNSSKIVLLTLVLSVLLMWQLI